MGMNNVPAETVIPPGGLEFFRPAEVSLLLQPVPEPGPGQEGDLPKLTVEHLRQLWNEIGGGERYPFHEEHIFAGRRRNPAGAPLPRGVIPMRRGKRGFLCLQTVNLAGWQPNLDALLARLREEGLPAEEKAQIDAAFAPVVPLSVQINDKVGDGVFVGDAGTGVGYLVRAASPNWMGSVF